MATKHQYWFEYSKEGRASFHSHLDTVRIFKRALRRSDLDVRFTAGFNPHIRFSTPNALPVGLAVREEAFSLCFTRAYDPAEIVRRLEEQLPEGFGVRAMDEESRSESEKEGEERLEFEILFSGDLDSARGAADLWSAQEKIVFDRKRTGGEEIELKRCLDRIEIEEGRILVQILPWNGRFPRLSELVGRFRAMSNYGDSRFRIYSVTRL